MSSALAAWGWDDDWASELAGIGSEMLEVARVTGQERDRWSIQTAGGAGDARLPSAGRLGAYPVVGDWVLIDPGPSPSDPWSIVGVIPRRSAFSRGQAYDGAAEQVLAANVDTVWIVHGLDAPLNPRRLERYLAVAWESGATPEVVLTKADLAEDVDAVVAEVRLLAAGVEVIVTSAEESERVEHLRERLVAGRTIALLGPSGAGKSTLINALAGTALARTGEVRERRSKGAAHDDAPGAVSHRWGRAPARHPGLRELRVWTLDEGLEQVFPEIDELARGCRFRDCKHAEEPGCAVLEAVASGRLDAERLGSYRKLQAEAAWQARRIDPLARAAELSTYRSALKTLRKYHPKYKDRK